MLRGKRRQLLQIHFLEPAICFPQAKKVQILVILMSFGKKKKKCIMSCTQCNFSDIRAKISTICMFLLKRVSWRIPSWADIHSKLGHDVVKVPQCDSFL